MTSRQRTWCHATISNGLFFIHASDIKRLQGKILRGGIAFNCMQVLQSYLGQVISGVAAYVTDRYVILHFEVELDNGRLERVPGLLHSDAADIADVVVRLSRLASLHLCSWEPPLTSQCRGHSYLHVSSPLDPDGTVCFDTSCSCYQNCWAAQGQSPCRALVTEP